MKRICLLSILLIGITGCTTTHYQTKDQLPKDIKYLNTNEQFEININDIKEDGRAYLTCNIENATPRDHSSEYIPSNIEKVKVIGIFNWVEKNGACILTRSLSAPDECTGTYYVCEATGFGYVFFPKELVDDQLSREKPLKEQREANDKYDAFLDKLKPADRDLLNSVRFGEYNQMVESIQSGANVEIRDFNYMTPLMIASQNGFDEMVKFLIKHKANINAATKDKTTALMISSSNGNINIVTLLIANGANVNLKGPMGMTAYDMAKFNNHTEIMVLLKAAGAK